MKTVVSAPGKIHLLGEHAVVYGKPAILSAINKRLYCTVENPDQLNYQSKASADYLITILKVVKQHLKLKTLPQLKISINSQIQSGYHLGSSAAYAVAVSAAVLYHLKKIWNPQLINQLAYEAEKKQHGNPSGGDNTIVTYGGFVWYRKELEFLRSIWQLPFVLPKQINHFFLINTGSPQETTAEMIQLVQKKMTIQKAKMINLLNQNEQLVKRLAVALKEGNKSEIITCIRLGERTLEGLGVVSRVIIPLIRQIEKIGGAVKILGGGGKSGACGFLLCFHQNRGKVETITQKYGFEIEVVNLGEEGVKLESGKIN